MSEMTEEQERLFLDFLPDMYRLLYSGKIVSTPIVFAKSCRLDIEDLKQIAAIAMILAVKKFDPERGIKFITFVVPVIRNHLLNYRRNLLRRNIETIPLDSSVRKDGDTHVLLIDLIPDDKTVESQAEVNLALEALPERTREMLLMHINGYTQREIGERFGMSQVHVSRLLNGKLLKDAQ